MVWQSWIGHLLAQKARERLAEELAKQQQAGHQQSGPQRRAEPTSADASPSASDQAREQPDSSGVRQPCDVGLVFALGTEAGYFEDRLDGLIRLESPHVRAAQGGLKGRNIVVVRSGVGRTAAAAATQRLIDGHHPAWVITAGFAGGLAPHVRRHDLLVASLLSDAAGTRTELPLPFPLERLTAAHPQHVIHHGHLLTLDEIVTEPVEKERLGQTHQALAVDMETTAIAEVCRNAGVPVLSVRVISDAMQDRLPDEVKRLARKQSTARLAGTIASTIWNRPSSVKDLLALQTTSWEAASRLAELLERVVLELPLAEAPS